MALERRRWTDNIEGKKSRKNEGETMEEKRKRGEKM